VLFHVAWARLLVDCVGRDDVVFGTVLSGRHGSDDAQRVFGMFINTLPLRVRFGGSNINEVVRETYKSIMELLMRQQTPLALAQRCSRVTPPLPLFTTLLNYRHNRVNAESTRDATANWKFEGARLIGLEERANYPITLCIDDYTDAFTLVMHSVAEIDGNRLVQSAIDSITSVIDELEAAPSRSSAAPTRFAVKPAHQRSLPNGSHVPNRSERVENESNYDPPVSPAEIAIAGIWQDLLDLPGVGRHDDFFKLGGHSLLAMQFVARVRTHLKKNVPLKLFFENPILCRIAALVDETATESLPSQRTTEGNGYVARDGADPARTVKAIRQDAILGRSTQIQSIPGLISPEDTPNKRPVFWAPSIGSVERFIECRRLMTLLSEECALHCFEPAPEFETIESLARHCVRLMRTKQPHGPYTLIGYCQCGHIAYEMARQLESEGESIDLLAIIDCSARAFAPSIRQHYYLVREKLAAARRKGFRNAVARVGRWAARGNNGRDILSISEAERPFLAHSVAAGKHRAKPFSGKIVLFRSEESVKSLGSVTLGWEAITKNLEPHVIPCGHTSILVEPGVNLMATTLKKYLARFAGSELYGGRR
jgi:thioesterase domain-containing protein